MTTSTKESRIAPSMGSREQKVHGACAEQQQEHGLADHVECLAPDGPWARGRQFVGTLGRRAAKPPRSRSGPASRSPRVRARASVPLGERCRCPHRTGQPIVAEGAQVSPACPSRFASANPPENDEAPLNGGASVRGSGPEMRPYAAAAEFASFATSTSLANAAGVVDRHVREDLAVEVDAGLLQAVHEHASTTGRSGARRR